MILAGEIRWVSMSKEARAALIKEQDAQRAESGGTLLKRKERSDKGAVRGPRVKQTNKTPRDAIPTLAAVGAGSGLPVPIPSLSHSPSVLDNNASRIPSTTNAPAASDAAPTSSPDLALTDLLQMSNDGPVPDLDFDLDFLNISNDMAAAFPEMMGMQPLVPEYYGNGPGPSSAVYAPDLGLPALPRPTPSPTKSALTPLDVNTGSKRTAAHLEDVNSGAPAKKQRKKRSDTGIARGPRK
jgi:hypothetical protein